MFKSIIAAEQWAMDHGWEKRKVGDDTMWYRPAQSVRSGDKWIWTLAYHFRIMKCEKPVGKEFWFFA